MEKITVKNISSATVGLVIPELHYRRELVPGRTIPVTKEEYDYLVFDPGFNVLLRNGFLRVSGIEEEQVVEEVPEAKEANEIYKMLADRDITSFARFIPNATPAEKDSVVKYATELGVVDGGFPALIKRYCDVDIIEAVNRQHQAMN